MQYATASLGRNSMVKSVLDCGARTNWIKCQDKLGKQHGGRMVLW